MLLPRSIVLLLLGALVELELSRAMARNARCARRLSGARLAAAKPQPRARKIRSPREELGGTIAGGGRAGGEETGGGDLEMAAGIDGNRPGATAAAGGGGEMDAVSRIQNLESAIYSGFAGRYRVPHIKFSDASRDGASVRAVFWPKTGKMHDAGQFAVPARDALIMC